MSSGWHRKRDTPATRARAAQYASPEHRQRRKAIQAQINAGQTVSCWRCGRPILPGQSWHLGHHDNDRGVYMGPECPPCNLKAAARKGARIANRRNRLTVRRRNWYQA